jgi:hypothetical protein
MKHAVLVAMVVAGAACGGDDSSSGEPDAPVADPPDAMPPPPPDASPASPFLVGEWRQLESQVSPAPENERTLMTFVDDGTWTLVEPTDPSETETGTWTADATTLNLTVSTSGSTLTSWYLATPDRLMYGALLPVGVVDGTVGTWRGEASVNDEMVTATLELRADNTAHLERQEGTDPIEILDGTWAYDVDDVVFTTMIDTTTVNLHFKEIRGVAIGSPLFERLPAAPARARGTAAPRPGRHVAWSWTDQVPR